MGERAASPTELLLSWGRGETAARDALVPLVQDELRRLARHYMSHERVNHTLQPTALVNEAYLRLVQIHKVKWQDRAHFFAVAARVMRRILVDSARAHRRDKRGPAIARVPLEEAVVLAATPHPDLVELDRALEELGAEYPRQCEVVELRYFGGLSLDERLVTGLNPELTPVEGRSGWQVGLVGRVGLVGDSRGFSTQLNSGLRMWANGRTCG